MVYLHTWEYKLKYNLKNVLKPDYILSYVSAAFSAEKKRDVQEMKTN